MIVLRGGNVYDASQGFEGEIHDIWIDNGLIVSPPEQIESFDAIDVSGMIVAPAAVEIHTHLAGQILADAHANCMHALKRDSAALPLPSEGAAGYLSLGYTTLFDAAMSPALSWKTHSDLHSMDIVDRGAFSLVGNHALLLEAIAGDDQRATEDILAWLLETSGGYAPKLVNPGTDMYRDQPGKFPTLDEPLPGWDITQRKIIQSIAKAAKTLGLPHPIHLHAAMLGQSGNWKIFVDTLLALKDYRAHLCHIQYYCYGEDQRGRLVSAVEKVIPALLENPKNTYDVGQVIFGPATAVSADLGLLRHLQGVMGGHLSVRRIAGEDGGGTLPLAYRAKNAVSAIQWATGLELLLRFPDPTRIFLTTDHPNGGPFTAYPQIINWLMNGDARHETLSQVHSAARKHTGLAELDREYTLSEILTMTSLGPAQALGLKDRGHLKSGARADIRCYDPSFDVETMFSAPSLVLKDGQVVVKNGIFMQKSHIGQTFVLNPTWDRERLPFIEQRLQSNNSIPLQSYGLGSQRHRKGYKVIKCNTKE